MVRVGGLQSSLEMTMSMLINDNKQSETIKIIFPIIAHVTGIVAMTVAMDVIYVYGVSVLNNSYLTMKNTCILQ